MLLPKHISLVKTPPIKCQGIKTKLINFIFENIKWEGDGRWVEPFLGSGVVLFNLNPKKAIAADSNEHIIAFYKNIQDNKITPTEVRRFLQSEGRLLYERGENHYYEVRERFNKEHNPIDLLFLNRACFNGVMRFNKSGKFNVPFCRKIDRFRPSYVTKIVNQVKYVQQMMQNKEWHFMALDWRQTLELCKQDDFVYLDPPYYGRSTDYGGSWEIEDMESMIASMKALPCGYALSLWKKNIYRENPLLVKHFSSNLIRVFNHSYFVGPTEDLRPTIEEALILKSAYDHYIKPDLQEKLNFPKATLLFKD